MEPLGLISRGVYGQEIDGVLAFAQICWKLQRCLSGLQRSFCAWRSLRAVRGVCNKCQLFPISLLIQPVIELGQSGIQLFVFVLRRIFVLQRITDLDCDGKRSVIANIVIVILIKTMSLISKETDFRVEHGFLCVYANPEVHLRFMFDEYCFFSVDQTTKNGILLRLLRNTLNLRDVVNAVNIELCLQIPVVIALKRLVLFSAAVFGIGHNQ